MVVNTSRQFPPRNRVNERVGHDREQVKGAEVSNGVKIPLQTILGFGRRRLLLLDPRAREIFAWICKSLFSDRVHSKPKTDLERNVPRRRPLLPRNWFISSLDLSPWVSEGCRLPWQKDTPGQKVRQPESRSTFPNTRRLDLACQTLDDVFVSQSDKDVNVYRYNVFETFSRDQRRMYVQGGKKNLSLAKIDLGFEFQNHKKFFWLYSTHHESMVITW